jgi:hypothetical protein
MMLKKINQLRLSKSDVANILDALNEWEEIIGARWFRGGEQELNDDEVGLPTMGRVKTSPHGFFRKQK